MHILPLQGANIESDRARARTNLTVTGTFKTAAATTSKRTAAPFRPISGATKLSNDLAVVIGANTQTSLHNKPLKIITEVDGDILLLDFSGATGRLFISVSETNIDEVLSLSDLSNVPTAFLTEIQQDQIYGTIFEELKKKIPHKITSTPSPPTLLLSKGESSGEQQEGNPQSAHLSSPATGTRGDDDDDDDDDASLIDDISSTISSINNVLQGTDGYDTDIESGAVSWLSAKKSHPLCVEVVVHEDHDMTGRAQYRDLCGQSKIIPCSYFMAHIQDRELVLRYHQFSTEDLRAIARTLSVRTLILLAGQLMCCVSIVFSSPICSLNVYFWMGITCNRKQRNTFLKWSSPTISSRNW